MTSDVLVRHISELYRRRDVPMGARTWQPLHLLVPPHQIRIVALPDTRGMAASLVEKADRLALTQAVAEPIEDLKWQSSRLDDQRYAALVRPSDLAMWDEMAASLDLELVAISPEYVVLPIPSGMPHCNAIFGHWVARLDVLSGVSMSRASLETLTQSGQLPALEFVEVALGTEGSDPSLGEPCPQFQVANVSDESPSRPLQWLAQITPAVLWLSLFFCLLGSYVFLKAQEVNAAVNLYDGANQNLGRMLHNELPALRSIQAANALQDRTTLFGLLRRLNDVKKLCGVCRIQTVQVDREVLSAKIDGVSSEVLEQAVTAAIPNSRLWQIQETDGTAWTLMVRSDSAELTDAR